MSKIELPNVTCNLRQVVISIKLRCPKQPIKFDVEFGPQVYKTVKNRAHNRAQK